MTPPPLPEDPRDAEQIRLLVIFHYVAAGLGVAGIFGLIFHYFLMSSVFGLMEDLPQQVESIPEVVHEKPAGERPAEDESREWVPSHDPVPAQETEAQRLQSEEEARKVAKAFSGIFDSLVYFYIAIGVFIVLKIILNFLSARYMTRRKNKVFSMIVAGLNCLSIPLGTILGIFTFVVLSRQTVEVTYQKARTSSPV